MAEIKSTLELAMERTRDLTMTEEDKRKHAAREFKEAVNRLVLRSLDGQIDPDRFRTEFGRLQTGPFGRAEAAAEIGRRIDPAADNTLVLDLIKHGLGYDISGIEAILKKFRETLHSEDRRTADRIRADLLNKGISGSAVIPNLDTDKDRAARRDEIFEAYREELDATVAQLQDPASPSG
jgi:hypothetical protein